MELKPLRWLPVAVLTAAVLSLILTESILAARGTVEIAQPAQGAVLTQQAEPYVIRGTAVADDLAYYQLSYSTRERLWIPIGAGRYTQQVRDGELAKWDLSRVPPGRYRVRLDLYDTMGNHSQSTVEVTVVAGQPK